MLPEKINEWVLLIMSKRIRVPVIQVPNFLITDDCDPVDLEEDHPANPLSPHYRLEARLSWLEEQHPDHPLNRRERHTDRPVVCDGCRNYYGLSHGGNRLICGMHPYGVAGEICSDWGCKDAE